MRVGVLCDTLASLTGLDPQSCLWARGDMGQVERSVGRLRTMHSKMLLDIEKVQIHFGGSVKASIPTARVIEGEALVTCPRHHLRVLDEVLHHHRGLDLEDPPAGSVREEDGPTHGVCGQVVFVCWAVAGKQGHASW